MLHQTVIVVAIGAWLCRLFLISQHIEISVYYFFQRLYHLQEFLVHWYLTARVLGLGGIDDQLGVLALTLHNINAFNGTIYGNRTIFGVDVRPFQTTNLSDTQTCSQTDIDAEVAESKVLKFPTPKNQGICRCNTLQSPVDMGL